MKNNIFKVLFVIALLALFGSVAEANNCSFNRTLVVGSRGEDVRCLQQYLYSSGYGAYFYGFNPIDGIYGSMTRQALMSWQSNHGLFATGSFDSQSRAKYYNMFPQNYYGGSVLGSSTSYYETTTFSGDEAMARQAIARASEMIEEAEEEIEDSNSYSHSAKQSLEDAKDDLLDAVIAFFVDRDYDEATDFAEDAYDNAEDAQDEADGGTDRDDAEDAIDDAEDAINDAEDAIDDAQDSGQYVGNALNLLDEAEDLLEEAEDELDDGDYDDAEDLADEARELAEEIVDIL